MVHRGRSIFYGLDFGANVWGSHLGVSTRRAAVERDFAEMAALGFRVARWFVFCDGRAGIVYDDRGLPAGLDPHFFADLDAALEIAGDAGIALDLVLLDHRVDVHRRARDARRSVHRRAARGAAAARPRARAARRRPDATRSSTTWSLRWSGATAPGGERADLAPTIVAYELMNEPDFVIEEWERDLSRTVARPLPFEVVAGLVTRLSDVVHAHPARADDARLRAPAQPLGVGGRRRSASTCCRCTRIPTRGIPQRDVDVFGMPASALGVSRPVSARRVSGRRRRSSIRAGASPPPTTLEQYLEFAVTRRLRRRVAVELQRHRRVRRGCRRSRCWPLRAATPSS